MTKDEAAVGDGSRARGWLIAVKSGLQPKGVSWHVRLLCVSLIVIRRDSRGVCMYVNADTATAIFRSAVPGRNLGPFTQRLTMASSDLVPETKVLAIASHVRCSSPL